MFTAEMPVVRTEMWQPGVVPSKQGGGLISQLIALASLLKELQTQSHLIHLNYESENFMAVHAFLKEQYEAHLEQFDTVSEFVRAQDHFMPMCACGLKDAMPAFRNCESYEARHMLMTYLANLETMIEMAITIEQMAGNERVIDAQNYMAELVAAGSKAAWFMKATLRGC